MYSLRLQCRPDEVEFVLAELSDWPTQGVRELEYGELTELIAGFAINDQRRPLLEAFARYSPQWEQEEDTDWTQVARDSWPPRLVGARIFLAPPWAAEPTPEGRVRVTHNPGLACGTGEHPCTQLALLAIEETLLPGMRVADIGTGSGILAIAARQLGAESALGTDLDEAALAAAQENFELNHLTPNLIAGSADCLGDACSDLTIANINGSVLLSIIDDLIRITGPEGRLILTGFPEEELAVFRTLLPYAVVTGINEWRCVVAHSPLAYREER